MATGKRPVMVDIYVVDKTIVAQLIEDGYQLDRDTSDPDQTVYAFRHCGVDQLRPKAFLRNSDVVEMRDSKTGEFVDPKTFEYIGFEELVARGQRGYQVPRDFELC